MLRHKPKIRLAILGVCACSGLALTAAVGQVALPDIVETAPLATDAFSTGTLDTASGAMGATLWRGSDGQTLEYLLTQLPSRPSTPSLGEALRRLLLSPGTGPVGVGPSLGGKKLLALTQAGMGEEARTISSISTASRTEPWAGQAEAVSDLLDGDIAAACRRNASLSSGRDATFWVQLRVLCYAVAGEIDAADLTLGILREQGALDDAAMVFLTAAATGVAPTSSPPVKNALQHAISRKFNFPVSSQLLSEADAGVLVAAANDTTLDPAIRIASAERAIGMGVMPISTLSGLMRSVGFDVPLLSNAVTIANDQSGDPLTDALLYQSVRAMSAPEFIRDKAQRISLALSLGDTFHRAYSLSLLYEHEIASLEGTIVTVDEASHFALARMAVGDSVGAGQWLAAMIGANGAVSALPEVQAKMFIGHVNLLSVLDPQTAAQIARSAGVSVLGIESERPRQNSYVYHDQLAMARIVEAAFDAALEGKQGQAGLAALAASAGNTPSGEIESVIVSQSLRAAGLSVLQRRYAFENTWAATFVEPVAAIAPEPDTQTKTVIEEPGGLMPRLKPRRQQ